jgi:hypothetical protein
MLMLDDFPGAVPPLAMRPDPAFEEKSERSYELNEISINSPRGVSRIITSESCAGPNPHGTYAC